MWKRTTVAYFLTLAIFSIAGIAYVKDRDKASRSPSSISEKKLLLPARIEKHLAPLKIEISEAEDIPLSSSETVTIQGKISINHPIDDTLAYSWSLPEDVELVIGPISEEISKVQVGQVIDVSITVKGFSKESQKLIALSVSASLKGEKIGNSTILPSRPEDTWEYVAPEMKKAADAQLGEAASSSSQ